ncbi:sodium channel subunit beta-4-like [Archocentrus centrarchus]|uniref:sodium channel subunit beta-4-like n=1 Tax=Archocentrus centrarchus TaxID=63155 RepID=UPI0011E9FCBC|nr:sodium channel subunit beta-4-like [Archocentrus centrarchus]
MYRKAVLGLILLCLLSPSGGLTDHVNVIAVLGQTVVLPCLVPNDDPIIAVHWSRSDVNPIHVLLYQSKRSNPANQQPPLRNRVDLLDRQMKDRDLSVIMKDVKFADTGTYECHVIQTATNHWKTPIMKTEPITIVKLRVDPVAGTTNDGSSECVQPLYFIFGLVLFVIFILFTGF